MCCYDTLLIHRTLKTAVRVSSIYPSMRVRCTIHHIDYAEVLPPKPGYSVFYMKY